MKKRGWTASTTFSLENTALELGIRLRDWDSMLSDERYRYMVLARAKSIMTRWESFVMTEDGKKFA